VPRQGNPMEHSPVYPGHGRLSRVRNEPFSHCAVEGWSRSEHFALPQSLRPYRVDSEASQRPSWAFGKKHPPAHRWNTLRLRSASWLPVPTPTSTRERSDKQRGRGTEWRADGCSSGSGSQTQQACRARQEGHSPQSTGIQRSLRPGSTYCRVGFWHGWHESLVARP
jgi:hypothetical protein